MIDHAITVRPRLCDELGSRYSGESRPAAGAPMIVGAEDEVSVGGEKELQAEFVEVEIKSGAGIWPAVYGEHCWKRE